MKEKRVVKVLKKCRQYLNWVQNSVFEGEISSANFFQLKHDLSKLIDHEEDSIIIYTFRSLNYSKREVIGQEKNELSNFL